MLHAEYFVETRSKFLEQAGYKVVQAYDPEQARRIMASNPINLAVLDVRLDHDNDDKDMSGLALAEDPDLQHIPKIMLTQYDDPRSAMKVLRPAKDQLYPAAMDFVEKTEGVDAFMTSVSKALSRVEQTALYGSGQMTMDALNSAVEFNPVFALAMLFATVLVVAVGYVTHSALFYLGAVFFGLIFLAYVRLPHRS